MDQKVVVACHSCGAKNQFSLARATESPTCGKCHAKLLPPEPLAATDATFAAEVERSPLPVLVDFWAPWCGPCLAFAPTLDRFAAQNAGKVKVVKVNVDENPRTASRFGIRSIPTLMLFRDGKTAGQAAGALPADALSGWVAQHL